MSPKSAKHIFIFAVFINKLQILVLNNYILAWNTRIQCRQALAVAARHIWCRHGVIHLSRRNKATLASDRRPSTLLEFSPALESWSDIYMCPTSCLIVPQMFSSFVFIRHLYISVTRLGCSLNALSSISWADTPLTADWQPVYFGTRPQFSKTFLKNCLPCL